MRVTEQAFATTEPVLFQVLTNPDTYPEWLVGAKRIREVSPDWPSPGSYFKHVVGFGPIAIPDRTTVLDIQETSMLKLLARARPLLKAEVLFDIHPHPDGCFLRITETPVGPFKFLSPLLQPLIRARNQRSVQRLVKVVAAKPQPYTPTREFRDGRPSA